MPQVATSEVALAENSPEFSPVPQKLLLRFLADNDTFTLVDARSPAEFAKSHINGAINLPHDASDDDLSSLPSELNAPIVVYCKTGKRAGQLKAKLIERGYTNVRVLLPEQIVWFDGMAVFNCGTPAAGRTDRIFESLTVDNNREGKL
jgi:rhodanese-related sulfurtransferase